MLQLPGQEKPSLGGFRASNDAYYDKDITAKIGDTRVIDLCIEEELKRARINIVRSKELQTDFLCDTVRGPFRRRLLEHTVKKVPTHITGELKGFIFERAERLWVVRMKTSGRATDHVMTELYHIYTEQVLCNFAKATRLL